MTDPDFRALCTELVAELVAWEQADARFSDGGTVRADADYGLAPRTRAALSQPAPEPPTGEKLTALVRVFQSAYNAKRSELRALPNPYREDTAGDMADHAGVRAVLARWGQGNG